MARVYQVSDSNREWKQLVELPTVDAALLYAIKRCAQMGKVEVVGPYAPVLSQHAHVMPDDIVDCWRLVPPGCGVAVYVTDN